MKRRGFLLALPGIAALFAAKPSGPGFTTGGMARFNPGTPAILHGGESVVPVSIEIALRDNMPALQRDLAVIIRRAMEKA